MVTATDRYAARGAADAVLVDYDPQTAVTDARAALADGAPSVHDEYDSNLCCTLAGALCLCEACTRISQSVLICQPLPSPNYAPITIT